MVMMGNMRAKEQLKVARRHLERVQGAWDAPTDWSDLSLYGFYCLEAAVMAAAKHFGMDVKRTHPSKSQAAQILHKEYGLPDIENLLLDLNSARKAMAYGDVPLPELDAEEVAIAIEEYVEKVAREIGLEGNEDG